MSQRLPILICMLGVAALPGLAQDVWVATWAASPQAPRVVFPRPPQATPPAANQGNQPAPFPAPPSFNNQTVRMIVRSSLGGRRVRVQLSNAFGTTPLKIGGAHIALRDKLSAIVPASDRPLAFSGKPSFTIPPGADILSDPVELEVPKLSDLAVSVYIPGDVPTPTTHLTGLHTTWISKTGDFTSAPMLADATTSQSWYWLSGVDVAA